MRGNIGRLLTMALPLFGALSLSVVGHCQDKPESGAIIIAHYDAMTGEGAPSGREADHGIRLAAKRLNEKGGVLGKPLVIETRDDKGKIPFVRNIAAALAADSRVVAVIGETSSARSRQAAPVFQKAGIPMITPSATHPGVTTTGDFIFRACFLDAVQGEAMAQYACRTLKAKKIVVLREIGNDYATLLADAFTITFSRLGGSVAADISYQSVTEGETDFSNALARIKELRPDAVYIPGYYPDVRALGRQARAMKIAIPLLGGDGWNAPALLADGYGKDLQGSYFTDHYAPDIPTLQNGEFRAAYLKEYGAEPTGVAALGYDALTLLADAIRRAGSTDRTKVRDALAATKDVPCITGAISLNKRRDAYKPVYLLQIKGAEFVYTDAIVPDK